MKRLLVCAFFNLVSLAAFSQEICNNGLDDDFDGFIDCYDGSCANDPACDGIFLGNDATCQSPPPVFPKFTMSLDFSSPNETTNHLSRMAIGDLDRDGVPEIVTMNRYTNTIFVLNGNDGSVKKKNDTIQFEPYWEVAIANIDNDNCGEIYFIGYMKEISFTTGTGKKKVKTITRAGGVYMLAYDCDLNFLWRTKDPLPNDPINFGIADFDGDGNEEIYAKDEIYDAKTGVRIVKTSATSYTNQNGGPVAVNIVGDSRQELVIGLAIYQVNLGARTKDSGSLSLLQNRTEYFIRDSYNATSVADYNLDGFLDVLASGSTIGNDKNTTVFLWDVQNNTLKTYSDPQPGLGSDYTNGWINGTGRLNIADLDGKNGMNASFVSGRFLYALDENFNLLWRVNINEETSGYTGCTLFDFNGDGKAEIVYRDERFLYIIEGTDGSIYSQQACISRTNREYPIVADVDADGSTELCVTCGFNDADAATNFNTLSYSRYSHVRVFKSAAEPWVPARRVWNQHGYFVVNVNDDLTIPTSLQAHHLVFSTGNCTQGPNRPLNKFLNQSPYLNSEGCPTYASADIAFAVEPTIVPPTCPNLNFTVSFKITNLGDVSLTGDIPITFYTTNPKRAGAVKLNTITATVAKLQKGDIFSIDNATVTGVGSDSLYVVLNDAGTTVPTPIVLPNTTFFECDYDNIRGVKVNPLPVTITALEVNGNEKCAAVSNGTARAFVPSGGGGENTADYNFYWSIGSVAKPIASIDYVGAIYSGISDGTYTVYARHKTANCNSDTTQVTVSAIPAIVPDVTVSAIANQTTCSPPNGKMEAVIAGGGAGYTIDWYDISLNPLGISGATANNLQAGSYLVVISKGSCTKTSLPATIGGPQVPDAQANVLQNVLDCSNPNSGSIAADALLGGVVQDPANYTFSWFQYNNVTSVQGSALPVANGTGPTRTGLPVGYYQVEIKDNATQCVSTVKPIVQVTSQTAVPDPPQIVILASQTSCDPLTPNGSMTANVTIGGVAQNPADYTFEWFKGQNTLPENLVTTVSDIKGKTVNQVVGGGIPYTVRVTNAFNCSAIADLPVTENILTPTVTLSPTPNSVCNPAKATSGFNGSVAATVTFDGVTVTDFTNYSFDWRQGSLMTDPVLAGASGLNVTQLDGGKYTLQVTRTDRACKSLPVTATVGNTPKPPAITITPTASTNCVGGSPNGSVSTLVTNIGVGETFTYQWYAGDDVSDPVVPDGNGGNSATVTDIQGGLTYTVLVTNNLTGCEYSEPKLVPDESAVPIVSWTSTPNGVCDPTLTIPSVQFNGTVTATATYKGVAVTDFTGYTFEWHNGTLITDPLNNTSTTRNLDNVNGGSYTFTATIPALNCKSIPATAVVNNIQDLPDIAWDSDPSTNCIAGKENGVAEVISVDANLVGATSDYRYQWYAGTDTTLVGAKLNGKTSAQLTGLQGGIAPIGTYTVLVINKTNGCKFSQPTQVTDAKVKPTLTLNVTDNGICDPAIAGISYSGALAGVPAYSGTNYSGPITYKYEWFDGQYTGGVFALSAHTPKPATTPLTDLAAGFYTARVTIDELGCSSDYESEEVKDVANKPELLGSSTPSTNCVAGKENGSAFLTQVESAPGVLAPNGAYIYQWYMGGDTTAIGAKLAGKSGFTLSGVQGGPGPLTAAISPLIVNGEYTVLVINKSNGCRNELTIPVADGQVKPTLVLNPTDNSICDPVIAGTSFSGQIDGVPSYGGAYAGPITYSYEWFDGNYPGGAFALSGHAPLVTTNSLTGLQEGFYTSRVTIDELGCSSDYESEEVKTNFNKPELLGSSTPSTNCIAGKENGSVFLTQVESAPGVLAPNGAYIYQWYMGNDTTALGAKLAGKNGFTLSGVQGGPGPLTAAISPLIVNGEYTVLTINKSTGCRNELTIPVADGQVKPTLVLNPTDNSICDPAIAGTSYSGEMAGVPSYGGTYAGPITYTYQWFDGNYPGGVFALSDHSPTVTTNLLTGLQEGFYTASVTIDELGCSSDYESEEIKADFDKPELLGSRTGSTNCVAGLENGTAFLTQVESIPGVVAPNGNYIYQWYMGTDTTSLGAKLIGENGFTLTQIQGGPGALTAAISPLIANGEYTILTINKTTGCRADLTIQVPDQHVRPTVSLTSTPNSVCDPAVAGAYNGTVTATPSYTTPAGATAPGGPTWQLDWSANQGPVGTLASIVVTAKGSGYTVAPVVITGDGAGAAAVANINLLGEVIGITITNPGTGYTNATATIGGDGAGATAMVVVYPGGPLNSAALTIDELKGGFYSVSVTLTEIGCVSDLETVEVIDQLWTPVIDIAVTPQTSCVTASPNGALAATVNESTLPASQGGPGGAGENAIGDYIFEWYTAWNPVALDPAGTPWTGTPVSQTGTNGEIANQAGNTFYGVYTTRLATGCVAMEKVLLPEQIQIPVVSLGGVVDFSQCAPPNGSLTATVDIAPALPTETYTFYWLREDQNTVTTVADDVIAAVATNTYPNRLVIGASGSTTDIFSGLIYGDYTVVVKDNHTQCVSLPITENIEDKTKSTITLDGTPKPSSCGVNDGVLEITAVRNDGLTSDFTFELHKGGPTNPTLPIVFSYLGVSVNEPTFDPTLESQDGGYPKTTATALPGLPNPTIAGLSSFIYTVIAEDDFGCKNYKTYFLPFVDPHGIAVTSVNSSICPSPFDPANLLTGTGSISVNINLVPTANPGANETQFSYAFYKGGVPGTGALAAAKIVNVPAANPYFFPASAVDCTALPGDPACNFDPVATTADLAPGVYTVEVKELLTASQCPVYEIIEIKQAVLPPLLNLAGALKANDACNPADFNGEADVEIQLNAADESATFGAVTFDLTVLDDAMGVEQSRAAVAIGMQPTITNLKPDRIVNPYTVRVETKIGGVANGCVVEKEIAIPDLPTTGELLATDLEVYDAEYCDPLLEASALVRFNDIKIVGQVGSDDITDYDFEWFTDATLTTQIAVTVPAADGAGTGGERLTNGQNGVANGTVTIGKYYARARKMRNVGGSGGLGCLSAPFEVTIGDKTVDPTALLTPTPNSSCDTGVLEGAIKLEATTATLGLAMPYTNPGVGSAYSYDWSGAAPADGGGNGDGLLVDDNFAGLDDGNYQVRIVNDNTGCFVDKTVTIDPLPPVFTLATSKTNQNLCFPSGSVQVTDTFMNGASEGGTGNFIFRWYDANPGITPDPYNDGSPLTTAGPAIISANLINNVNYPSIAAGTYFVKAIRNAPGGFGCTTNLVSVEILDVSEDPIVNLTPAANTACDGSFEGGIQVAITETALTSDGTANPGVGQQYVYDWSTAAATTPADDGGMFPLPAVGPYVGVRVGNENPTSLADGFYTLTAYNNVTGCSSSDTKEIIKNQTPVVILQTNPTHQNLCFPSGSALVQGVSLDGTPEPAGNVTSDYDYTWSTDLAQASIVGDADTDLDVIDLPTIGAGNYYVKATRKSGAAFAPGSGCESPVVKVEILDVSEDPIVNLTPAANTACDGSFEGSIQVAITETALTSNGVANPGVGQQYVYNWSTAAATTPADDDGMFPLPAVGPYLGTRVGNENPTSLADGFYTLTAYNNVTGCSSSDTKEIIKNQTPVVILQATPTHQNLCFPSGSALVQGVSLDGTPEPAGNVTSDYDYIWSTDLAQTSIVGDADTDLDVIDLPTIGSGNYYVKAIRKSGAAFAPGSGCESPVVKVEILDVSEDPIVNLIPAPNTACDASFEGSIQVSITETALTSSGGANPGVGQQYVYDWSSTATTTPVDDGVMFPLPGTGPLAGTRAGNETFTTLQNGFYTLTAYNNVTGCSSTETKEVILSETPIVVLQLSIANQQLCSPADGQINITNVTVDGLTDAPNIATNYTYTWYQNNLSTVLAGQTAPSLTGLSFGGYFVKAKRNVGLVPGSGCESSPVRVDVADRRQYPIVTYLLQENTACDTNYDGRITVLSSDQPGPGFGSNYDISWPVVPTGSTVSIANNVGASYITPLSDVIGPDNYTVQVLNRATQCATPVQIEMTTKPEPIEILTVTTQDQDICYPDGSVAVTSLSSGNVSDYTFEWYRADVNTAQLKDDASSNIVGSVLQPGSAAGQYPTMGADAFYVVGIKNAGNTPGSGCKTAPFRADVLDVHVDPIAQLSFIANSSCSPANSNGIALANVSEANGSATDTYSFAWTFNNGALPGSTTVSNTNNSSQLASTPDGRYNLTVTNTSNTGCSVSAAIDLLLDKTRSTPNIIDVTTVDPLDCNPTGGATVTKITLGSTTNSSLFPPNVPPNNEVTGAGLLSFNYEWYKDSFGAGNQLPAGGPPFTTTPNINSLVVGTYFVLVHDPSTDCRSGLREVVIKPDNIVYPVLDVVQTAKQVGCLTTTGSAELTATADGQTSANANYVFTWFNNPDNTPPTIGGTSTISNLLAGTYSVTVRDNTTACTASAAYIVTDDTEEFRPVVSMGSQPRTLCVGTDGAIVARVINVDPSYPFPYDNTTFTADLYVGATPNLGAAPDVPNMSLMSGFTANFMEAGLNEGFYTVRITDNNTGCVGIGTEEIKDTRKYPVLAVEEIAPMTNCDPARPNGVAQATANGTFVGFQFDWYEGSSVSGTPVYTGAEYGQVKGLPQVYVVRATDINSGCTSDLATSVKDATVPIPAPTIEVLSHVTSCLIDNGALGTYVGMDRNTKDYVFDWYDGTKENPPADYIGEIYTNLAKGNYSVTATSIVTGCKSPLVTGEVLIKQEFPDFNFFVQNSSCDKSDGYASLVLVSDVPIETIEWSNEVGPFLIGPNFTDAAAGVYTVTATSFLGCATTKEVEILPDIHAYNGISRNNDGRNEIFQIDCIQNFPSNIVKIFNRAGTLVYEAEGYDNSTTFFDGKSNRGLSPMGVNLPDGTYFYIVDKRDGSKPLAGYLEIVK